MGRSTIIRVELDPQDRCASEALSDALPHEEMSPAERTLRARLAAHSRWAQEPDRTAATAAARRAFEDRFEREVDPDGVLDPAVRAKRAASARKAYYQRLSFKAAAARRRRRAS